MKIDIITIFPNFYQEFLQTSMIRKALEHQLVTINIIDLREYSDSKHQKIDDTPYGGGSGMIMMYPPFYKAITSLKKDNTFVIFASPQGKLFNQELATTFSKEYEHIIILCGHYDGIDERVLTLVDAEISIGDYILTGGEIASMVLADAIVRLIPGVINEENVETESIQTGLLKYPQYTRPFEFNDLEVPEVLTSGHHQNISDWRLKHSLKNTYFKRPDLLTKKNLSNEELQILEEIKKELVNEKASK